MELNDHSIVRLCKHEQKSALGDVAGKNAVTKERYVNGSINIDQYLEYLDKNQNDEVEYAPFAIESQLAVSTSASNIHEVDLFGDNRDSDSFWNQHKYTKADYYELASHIPEIEKRLNAGEHIENLYEDAVLGACARNYFDPKLIPKVIQYKNTFISQGGNRHRILAAQDMGFDILVKVVGIYNPITPKEKLDAADDKDDALSKNDSESDYTKKKFSSIQYAILGGTLLWLLLMYWIAAPSGLLQHLLWFVSAAIPFVPVVLLLRAFPSLRNKKGGILLLVLFAVFLLLIQKFYFWLSIAYVVGGVYFLIKNFTDIMPSLYSVRLKDADGTTTTETHVLGDNPEQDIKSIDSGYISQGYTKK